MNTYQIKLTRENKSVTYMWDICEVSMEQDTNTTADDIDRDDAEWAQAQWLVDQAYEELENVEYEMFDIYKNGEWFAGSEM